MQISGSDIRLLRVFSAVVRNRGFAAAQAELNVSQPTISGQISALEERLGVTLCQRGRAGFRLTPQGEVVHQAVERLLIAMEGFVVDTSGIRGTLAGHIRIGMNDSVATDPQFLLPEVIARFGKRAPDVRFHLQPGSPQDLQSLLTDERIDIAIGAFPHKITGLDYQPIYDERNLVYCGREHPCFALPEDDISVEELRRMPVVARSYWRDDHLNNRDFQTTVALASGVEQQLLLLLSGRYIGYLPEHAAAPYVAAGQLRCLVPKAFEYTCAFEAVTRRSAAMPPAVAAFMEMLLAAYNAD